MEVTIKKWGNSLAARLPKSIVEKGNLNLDQKVDVDVVDGKVVLTPIRQRKSYLLDVLLAQCDPEVMELGEEDKQWLHDEPKGREIL
ncbi:MAG: AbrB/MazE/SpoVT family DNA-binding domain-containing protein [Desulfobacterales bacterium]|nr:AbrB/MazE/SpoVT family DNA-binding domain-containing protein [Desulfobacterales bacterium]